MSHRVEFRVDDYPPPKKDGANSMWAKSAEVPRLVALRRAALEAMSGQPPFRSNIHLKLEIHCSPEQVPKMGDLDNFITGVCDGLMAADTRIKRDVRWDAANDAAIHPSLTIAIKDDSQILSIAAKKIADTLGRTVWYTVSLEGE